MNKQTRAFIGLHLKTNFSISRFFENFKGGKKKVGKNIAFIFLALYLIVFVGGAFAFQINALYLAYKPQEMQSIILRYTAVVATIISFFFGFLHAVSTYMTNESEENFLAFPVKPVSLLTGKWITSYLLQLPFVMLITITGCVIYGIHEHLMSTPLFYFGTILGGLTLPLYPYCVIYLLLTIIFRLGKGARSKKILIGISTAIMIVVLYAFNGQFSKMMDAMNNPEAVQHLFTQSGFGKTLQFSTFYQPIEWFSNTFNNATGFLQNILSLFLLIAIGLGASLFLMQLLGPIYGKSLIGFNETVSKKLKKDETSAFISQGIKSSSLFKSLVKRDVKNMLREPIYVMNGPLMVVLFPVLIVVSLFFALPEGTVTTLMEKVTTLTDGKTGTEIAEFTKTLWYWATAIGGFIGILLGSLSSVGATCFSREGKGLQNLKSMPLDPRTLVQAKMAHAMIYGIIATIFALVGVIAVFTIVPLTFNPFAIISSIILVITLSMSGTFIMQLVDMAIDTAHPKLVWETPQQAIKQNLNSAVGVFLPMGLVTILVLIAIFLPHNAIILICILALFSILDKIFWTRYEEYATKQFYEM